MSKGLLYWKKIKAREQGEMDNMPIMQMAGSAQPVQRRGISGSGGAGIFAARMVWEAAGYIILRDAAFDWTDCLSHFLLSSGGGICTYAQCEKVCPAAFGICTNFRAAF